MDEWVHFQFESGANPYISFSKENAKRKIKMWNKKGFVVEKLITGFYLVHDKRNDAEWLN